MNFTRRDFVLTGLSAGVGLLLTGCGGSKTTASTLPSGSTAPPRRPAPQMPNAPGSPTGGLKQVLARSRWAKSAPIKSRINPMGSISRITLHHEGSIKPFYATDFQGTAQRIELVRKAHLQRGWGDIGYHYIVDRSGRVWEGRPLVYQGAHVRDNNEHNIGVMCLGNFDIQSPTNQQVQALSAFVRDLRRHYGVAPTRIFTHQELMPTACPGRAMQPRVVAMRRANVFA